MFSSRLPSSLEPNEFSIILEAKKLSCTKLLDLTQSNPTQAGFSFDFLGNIYVNNYICNPYQPSAKGLQAARESICRYYRDNHHGQIAFDDLFLTASTSEAYSFLLKLLSDPGDEVLIPCPSYPLFDMLATLENVTPVRYSIELDSSGQWRIDFKSLAMMVSSLTKAIVVVNPNNPTGSFLSREELQQLNEICRTHKIALIVDEVFLDYKNPHGLVIPFSTVSNTAVLTFTLSGLSKILALPQAKLSWIHINGPDEQKDKAKNRLEFIADTYLSVSSMIQHGTASLFGFQNCIQQQILQCLHTNEEALKSQPGLNQIRREGGWYAIIELPDHITDEECCLDLLQLHSLIVHPGFFYDFEDSCMIIVSLITPHHDFNEGILILQHYLHCRRK